MRSEKPMYLQRRMQKTPSEVIDGLLVACVVVGILAGIVFGIRLYNSIVSAYRG